MNSYVPDDVVRLLKQKHPEASYILHIWSYAEYPSFIICTDKKMVVETITTKVMENYKEYTSCYFKEGAEGEDFIEYEAGNDSQSPTTILIYSYTADWSGIVEYVEKYCQQ